ncbi:MAG TPA: molybdenum cofactor biosynthesis protein [Elusimicrobia bacterium]|nr:molybdenum cofactor biosynthesis protein [Elusimicrobiota bacterium]
MKEALRVGVLTVSDRSARGEREDESGPALGRLIQRLGWAAVVSAVVPDDRRKIAALLRRWCAPSAGLDLVLTTGGTGLGPRDVTPEATLAVVDKAAPGLSELMRARGLRKTPFAALSRGVCGSLRRTLVVNLPGSPRGARESLEAVAEVLPHAVKMLRGGGH